MKIKLDENLSRYLKDPLQQRGYDAATAVEEGLLSKPDTEVGAAAKSEGRIIFTLDLEFADLRKFPPGSHPGVIVFRPRSLGPMAVNEFILRFLEETDLKEFERCVVVAEPGRIRVRRPPLDMDSLDWKEFPI